MERTVAMHHADGEPLVRIVRYTSECDVRPISVAIGRAHALATLRRMRDKGVDLAQLDLVSAETGRFVSWIV